MEKERCGKRNSGCACTLDKEACDGRHLCMIDACGGSWKGDPIMGKDDILLIPSSWKWEMHIMRSESLLNMDPGEAAMSMLMEDMG